MAAGSSGTSTVSTAVANGFNSAVSLTTSAAAGITVTLNPPSITGANTSTITVTVDPGVAFGPYTVAITGSGGGISRTVNLLLYVISPVPVATPAFRRHRDP